LRRLNLAHYDGRMKLWLGLILLSAMSAGCDDDSMPLDDLSGFYEPDLATNLMGDAGLTAAVEVVDDFFSPRNVIVLRGGTVTWTWLGSDSHTVTNDTASTEIFDSSPAKSTGTFQHTFNTAGAFGYHCMIHGAMMSANVSVQ
jgi:plastocyanin